MVSVMHIIRRLLLVSPLALVACSQPSMTGGFDSPNPAAKMHATVEAVRNGDQSAVRHIVEQLDSDDPAVRLLAIMALERLTGQTLGYEHDASKWDRNVAIERWVRAVESQEIDALVGRYQEALAQGDDHE